MGSFDYRLESQSGSTIESPTPDQLRSALESLHPVNNSFVALQRSDGGHVQTAGARLRLTIEWREPQNPGFRRWVLGRGEPSATEALVNCSVGPIRVFAHEVLTIDEAKCVFLEFLATGSIPTGYGLRDAESQPTG